MEMEMLAEDEQRHHLSALLFTDDYLHSTSKPQEAMEAWRFDDHLKTAEILDWIEEHATPPADAGSPTVAGAAPDARSKDQQQQHEEDVAFWARMFDDMARGNGVFGFGDGGAADEDESTYSTAPMEGVELAWGEGNFYTVDEGGDDTAAAGGPAGVVAPLIDLELRL